MGIGNVFVLVILTYHILYLIQLSFKHNRLQVIETNNKLEEIRKGKIVTLEDQKKFLDCNYPKSGGKFTWGGFFMIVLKILTFIILFRTTGYVFYYYHISFVWWQSILIIFGFPLVFNYILKKFKLQQDNTLENILK
jgi:hypothetical protein